MGFDLTPKNKKAGDFHMGAFSWHWMLNAGVGLPLTYGQGFTPASYVYRNRKDGLCIGANDGAVVQSREAKDMAAIATLVADYQDVLNDIWMMQSEEERKRMLDSNTVHYNIPVRRDFVELVRDFAAWAEKSGGFKIY